MFILTPIVSLSAVLLYLVCYVLMNLSLHILHMFFLFYCFSTYFWRINVFINYAVKSYTDNCNVFA